MSRCRIIDTGHPEVVVKCSRNPRFVDEMLRALPRRSRRHTGARWFVRRECLARLEAIAKRHFDEVVVDREAA